MVDFQEIQHRNNKVKVAEMADAIRQSSGIKAVAARILNVNWNTVNAYIKKYPTCLAAYEEATKQITDIARGNLVGAIRAGDVAESKWWLSKKDPDFKETQRVENVGSDDGPMVFKVVYDEPEVKDRSSNP